jgi:ABC-type transporter Mla subunit MlaD
MNRPYFFFAVAVMLSACRSQKTVYADLPDAEDLKPGAAVIYRGLEIGEVQHIAASNSGVRATISLARNDVPLRVADQARVAHLTPIGTSAIEIVPGPRQADQLQGGGVIAAAPIDSVAVERAAISRGVATKAITDVIDSLKQSVRK